MTYSANKVNDAGEVMLGCPYPMDFAEAVRFCEGQQPYHPDGKLVVVTWQPPRNKTGEMK